MNSNFGRKKFRSPGRILNWSAACVVFLLSSCASTSRLYPGFNVPPESHRLVEILEVGTREQIMSAPFRENVLSVLLASGIKESDITDGSIALGQVYCCHGPASFDFSNLFYIPEGKPVIKAGDIVEIRSGRLPAGNDPGQVNMFVQVRQKGDVLGGTCRWIPPDLRLWLRVLYCDWMQAEGWVEQTGMGKTWLKHSSSRDR